MMAKDGERKREIQRRRRRQKSGAKEERTMKRRARERNYGEVR